MDSAKNYKPNNFYLNTKKHGIVEFSYLSVWRNTLIFENTNKIHDIEPPAFCLIVAKYLILRKDNLDYDEKYYKTIKTPNDIKLILDKDEMDNFSKEFVSLYKTEISDYASVDDDEKRDNYKIIKTFFLKTKEEFDRIVKNAAGFTNLGYNNKTLEQVNKIADAAKAAFTGIPFNEIQKITEAGKVLSGISSTEINRMTEAGKAFAAVPKIALPKLPFDNFSALYKSFTENAKVLNQIVKPHLKKALETGFAIYKAFDEKMYDDYQFKQEIKEKWDKLELEIKTQNRYFIKSDLLDIFKKCAAKAKYNFDKNRILYRARKIDIDNLPEKIKHIINKAAEDFNAYEYQKLFEKEKDIWDYIKNMALDIWEQDYINKFQLQGNPFWGFPENESDAPPAKDNVQGRVNPAGISYLYTANSPITAISEIQPTIGQLVSVAKIKPMKTLNLFNFDINYTYKDSDFLDKTLDNIKNEIGISFDNIRIFFNTISEEFSKPSLGLQYNYYATQYISEFIKNLGFDGLVFKSSLKKGGKNIVLFDISKNENDKPVNYQIISTSLHKVDNIKITSKLILPKEMK